MRKLKVLLFVATATIGLTACGNTSNQSAETGKVTGTETVAGTEVAESDRPETITIQSYNGNKEAIDLEVPYDPKRIAILDLAALDTIDSLGMGDRVVGTADTSIEYLADYSDNEDIMSLGTIKEADLEAVMASEPEVIFIGGRLAASYDTLSEIAPVVYLSTDPEIGLLESVTKNATQIASMFGMQEVVKEKMAGYTARINALQKVAEDKTALIGMTTSGSFNLLGNDGRCSVIGVEIGFDNLTKTSQSTEGGNRSDKGQESGQGNDQGNSASTSTHGNESSFETVVEQNPDYIFVMDRDRAIGADGAQFAQEIMENELIKGTDAYQNGTIVYLENPSVWYTAEGGITALDIMLSDLESQLL